jgi:hypothetical protein
MGYTLTVFAISARSPILARGAAPAGAVPVAAD